VVVITLYLFVMGSGSKEMRDFAITLSFSGSRADLNEINFYDVSQALMGFERSLALTTHLILNGQIITQAPALKGAEIIALPAAEGSWRFSAAVIVAATGAYHLGTAPKDTPIGHLIRSGYDYVISEALGFHVDYDKSLGQQYEELKKAKQPVKELSESRFDSLIEKCENSIRDMHRPLVKSETAHQAVLTAGVGGDSSPLGPPLTRETYEYIAHTERSPRLSRFTSYNINTFKGRVYLAAEGRPIPFELDDTARGIQSISAITTSLAANAHARMQGHGEVTFNAFRNNSRTGRLKYLLITEIVSQ
jgi:hypothetical protein